MYINIEYEYVYEYWIYIRYIAHNNESNKL